MQEEKKAKEEKDAVIAAAKKRGAEKAKLTKSLIIMDVKPWDDTTGAPALPTVVAEADTDRYWHVLGLIAFSSLCQ